MSVSTHWWRGADDEWYLHTIYPIDAVPDLGACNYIAACPLPDGLRRPFYIGQTGDGGERFPRHEKLGPAIRLGATELHVYLGARSRRERLDIETTLRNLHRTPLNDQPSVAPSHLGFPAGLINRTAADTGGITPGRNALAGATPGFGALGIMAGMIGRSPYDAGGIAPPARNALSSGAISGIAADLGGYSPFGFGGLAAAASHGMRPASASPYHNPLMPAVEPEPSKGLMSRYLTAPPSRQS